MSTLTVTPPRGIQCGACGGMFIAPTTWHSVTVCVGCHRTLSLARDIEPNLDEGERLVWMTTNLPDVYALAFFTESLEDDGEDEA